MPKGFILRPNSQLDQRVPLHESCAKRICGTPPLAATASIQPPKYEAEGEDGQRHRKAEL